MGTLTSLPREAIKGAGGIKYVLLSNYADTSTSIDADTGYVTIDTSVSTYWTKFTPRKESSNFAETETGTPASGITSYNQVLTLVFAYNQTAKRNQLKVMGQSELKAVVVDRNDNAWALGFTNGLDLTGATAGSGTAPTDMNGMTWTLSGNEPEPFGAVSSAVLGYITDATNV